MTAPITGGTPVTTITATTEYTGTVTWSPADATFAANTVYTATVTLTAIATVDFIGVPADYFTVAGATATNSANSGTVTAAFPATGGSGSSSGCDAGFGMFGMLALAATLFLKRR